MKDAFGNEITLGSYLIYATSSGMRLARVYKIVQQIRRWSLQVETSIHVNAFKSGYAYKTTLQALENMVVMNPNNVPVEIQNRLK